MHSETLPTKRRSSRRNGQLQQGSLAWPWLASMTMLPLLAYLSWKMLTLTQAPQSPAVVDTLTHTIQKSQASKGEDLLPNHNPVAAVHTARDMEDLSSYPTFAEFRRVNLERGRTASISEMIVHNIQLSAQLYNATEEDRESAEMLMDELKFLLGVVKKSPKVNIDLSEAVMESLESAHKLVLWLPKVRMNKGWDLALTKQDSIKLCEKWIYRPLELLLEASTNDQYPNIQINFEYTGCRYTTILAQAVSHRLLGAAERILQSGGSRHMTGALLAAIINDDLESVTLLLKWGASPYEVDAYNRTMIDVSKIVGYRDIFQQLLQATSTIQESQWELPTSTSDIRKHKFDNTDGGWADLGLQIQVDGLKECSVSRMPLQQLSMKLFLEDFVSLNRPLLITEAVADWPVQESWKLDTLLSRHGEDECIVSSIPYGKVFGIPQGRSSLANYTLRMKRITTILKHAIERHQSAIVDLSPNASKGLAADKLLQEVLPSLYVFDNHALMSGRFETGEWFAQDTRLSNIIDAMAISASVSSSLRRNFQFYMGALLTGAPFHLHCAALNVLAHGRKYWMLLPPSKDIYSKVHPLEWYKGYPYSCDSLAPSCLPCYMEQRSGEALFLPRHWTHAVINLAETVGFAAEISGLC